LKKSTLITIIAISSSLSGLTQAELSFDANLELDTDAINTKVESTTYDQNGFVELNIYGKHQNGDNFVLSKGTVRLTTDGDDHVVVRDAYIQLGNSKWDLQIGRFEAIDLFPLGKDTVIQHAGGVSVYEANKVRGFVGDDGGQIALHINPTKHISFEIDTLFGDDDTAGDNTTAAAGVRPSATWRTDGFRITAGYEKVRYDLIAGGEIDQQGYALSTNFDLGAANINAAASYMEDDTTDQEVNSYIINFNYKNLGGGVIFSQEDNATGPDPEVTTAYLAYTVPIFDIKNANVTFAGSFSTADDVEDDETTALRMRFNYTF